MRLFRAWSMVNNFRGQDRVRMDWFVVGRTVPPASWEELIQDYDDDDDNCGYDQMLVNELFTGDEAEKLKVYLAHAHNLELHMEEVDLPVKSGGLSCGLLLISGEPGFYALADEAGYGLSFSVLGHFSGQESDPAVLLSDEEINTGANFLEIVFKHLNLAVIDRNELYTLLQKIYAENGWHVIEDKS